MAQRFTITRWRRLWPIFVACALIYPQSAPASHIYKWVDEQGITHYSEKPPAQIRNSDVSEVEIAAPASDQVKTESKAQKARPVVEETTNPELGPLPLATSSDWLETLGTFFMVALKSGKLEWRQSISLRTKSKLPYGAYLEVHFEDPTTPTGYQIIGKTRRGGKRELQIESKPMPYVLCRNYDITVYIYRGTSKSTLLGIHRQIIQSRVDSRELRTQTDAVLALAEARSGICVRAPPKRPTPRALSLHDYGRIHEGMSEQEVRKIAAPHEIRKAPQVHRPYDSRAFRRGWDTVFIYKGSGYATITSRVFFSKGRVVAKKRSTE